MKLLPMIVAVALAMPAAAQSKAPSTADLLAKIEMLEKRIASLESRFTESPNIGIVGAIPTGDELRLMRVLRIESLPPDAGEIARADALDRDAAKGELESAKARPGDGAKGADRSKANRIAEQHESEAKAKRTEAARIRRLATEPRHRVTGWNGSRFVVLTTERDCSSALTRVAAGDFVGWSGQRTRLSATTDEYAVRGLTEEDRPLNFIDPPATAKLPEPYSPPVQTVATPPKK